MDHADRYARACFPDRWRAAGVRLQPFTLGHALLLRRIASPFASFGGTELDVPAPQFVTALFTCSHPWQEASERIGRRLPLRWLVRSWLLMVLFTIRPLTLWNAVATFNRYLLAAWDYPDVWLDSGESREPGSPQIAALKAAGMRLGYSENAVLSAPLQKLLWEVAVNGEMNGRHEIVNEVEAEAMKA